MFIISLSLSFRSPYLWLGLRARYNSANKRFSNNVDCLCFSSDGSAGQKLLQCSNGGHSNPIVIAGYEACN